MTFGPLRKKLPPTILTIFGATGDLSANYLLPALHHMDMEGFLPKDFRLVAVGRREFDSKSFLKFIVQKSRSLRPLAHARSQKHFLRLLTYFQGNFDDHASFGPLKKILSDQEKPRHQCFNRLYYFAASPQFFSSLAHILKNTGLLTSCAIHDRKIRILVEKPFGFNLKSARALNKLLLKYFNEEQIYRIDHYLGKETVQNLMVARFANILFEPLWNRNYIGHVEISVLENEGIGTRGQSYDQAGALKDVVQNHILQMLSLIAMDEPRDLHTELIRDEKLKILKALRAFDGRAVKNGIVRAQYVSYQKELGRESQTETFVALKTYVDLPRWQGVPFYLRTGKALSSRSTEISIHFKELKRCLFRNCRGNILTFRIQPDESVYLQINNKVPGFGVDLHQANLEFGYKTFKKALPPAYERLLLDFIEGDQRLFIRSDEIEAAWKFIDSITDNWHDLPLYTYKIGTTGPKEADEFIKKDNKEWQTK